MSNVATRIFVQTYNLVLLTKVFLITHFRVAEHLTTSYRTQFAKLCYKLRNRHLFLTDHL